MKTLIAAFLFCGSLLAQATGSVTVEPSPVSATAGTVTCRFTTPSISATHVVCSIGGTVKLTMDAVAAVGPTNGFVGSFTDAGNSVTWAIQQLTAGVVTWQIAANGTAKSGTF